MRKVEELTNVASCMSIAKDQELTFVLLGRDAAASVAIRAWVSERIRLGKNTAADSQIIDALQLAEMMEAEREDIRNAPNVPHSPFGVLQLAYARLNALLNTPELHNFSKAVVLEAAHQRERWGSEHDAGKSSEDWFWVVAYLATKAHQALRYEDKEKALHHLITTAAALANWHAQLLDACNMRPGLSAEKQAAIEAGVSS
jgi:hypothetical protein